MYHLTCPLDMWSHICQALGTSHGPFSTKLFLKKKISPVYFIFFEKNVGFYEILMLVVQMSFYD